MDDVTPTPPAEPEEQEEEVTPTGKSEVSEESKEEEQEEEPEIAQDPVEEPEEEPDPPVSRRESKRIKQLLDKLDQHDERQMQQRQPQRQPSRQIIPEGEYDLDQVNSMAQEYGQQLYKQALTEAQAYNIANTFATRLEIDAPKVSSRHQFLDEDSKEFNPGATDFINRMYLKTVGYDQNTGVVQNQDLRYGDFVDGFMDVVELVATGRTAESTKNVARQAAQTGVRPGGVAKPDYRGDDPRRMTDDQLDAAIKAGLGA